ncbi:MAG: alpha/beta hydrolase [Frankia sp.]
MVTSLPSPLSRQPATATATATAPRSPDQRSSATQASRTSVLVLPGRGEESTVFDDLAFRLALDGHAVRVAGPHETATSIGEARIPDAPFVVLGSDTGALRALTAAASPALRPDGLVLFGLPLLYRRSAGRPLAEPPPHALPDLPILLVHGSGDEISPLSLVRPTAQVARRADLVVVAGGHQIVTGPGRHFATASTLVFLETLVLSRSA